MDGFCPGWVIATGLFRIVRFFRAVNESLAYGSRLPSGTRARIVNQQNWYNPH
jgi:hypothetical protein